MIEFVGKSRKLLFGLFLSFVTAFFAISTATPSQAINANPNSIGPVLGENQVSLINYQKMAEAELIAENRTLLSQAITFNRFAAILSGDEIYPKSVDTKAAGVVGAALSGNRLIVRGGFRDLSAPLRDYATDPLDPPNPNITSGVHIHRGMPTQNGPFQYALQVAINPDGLSGNVKGEYTLNDEQLQALNSGSLYVDIHTKGFRAGELRGVLKAQQ
ncbi:CHRD domain-containing protein [Pseudanabaena mucicola]|uniref:CHRD domain-containing protein n=1 Tax=Pseudanabaena mucicola FACHB-723 TaxID=2692860 RepID=A0ABR8A2R5_9CYAN|nr:CHRD domain-containing protein [Pseudanabaena mucicola]MBD2189841.1 CHRD domain-containing protein [Pseudanabaena mucicola FACHB-723]